MTNENNLHDLESLLENEILSLTEKSKPLHYKFIEGKFTVGYNKRAKKFFYHLDGMAVEEFETKLELSNAIKGYLPSQNQEIIKSVLKSKLKSH